MTDSPRRRLRWWQILLALLLTPLVGVLLIELQITLTTQRLTYTDLNQLPVRQVAIVFGAQVLPNGNPSNALAYRVEAAAALYRAGKVHTLLFTGDNREENYNEPQAMADYARTLGVPAQAIIRDPAGLRTYDSCYRARNVYGVSPGEAIVVTQSYHLPRAIFTCNGLGLDVLGYVAQPFNGQTSSAVVVREHVARWLAWWQVYIQAPQP